MTKKNAYFFLVFFFSFLTFKASLCISKQLYKGVPMKSRRPRLRERPPKSVGGGGREQRQQQKPRRDVLKLASECLHLGRFDDALSMTRDLLCWNTNFVASTSKKSSFVRDDDDEKKTEDGKEEKRKRDKAFFVCANVARARASVFASVRGVLDGV